MSTFKKYMEIIQELSEKQIVGTEAITMDDVLVNPKAIYIKNKIAELKKLANDKEFKEKLKKKKENLKEDKDFSDKVSQIFRLFSNIKEWNYLDIDIIMRSFNYLFDHKELLAMTAYDTMKKNGETFLLDTYNKNCKKSGTSAHNLSRDGGKVKPEETESFNKI